MQSVHSLKKSTRSLLFHNLLHTLNRVIHIFHIKVIHTFHNLFHNSVLYIQGLLSYNIGIELCPFSIFLFSTGRYMYAD